MQLANVVINNFFFQQNITTCHTACTGLTVLHGKIHRIILEQNTTFNRTTHAPLPIYYMTSMKEWSDKESVHTTQQKRVFESYYF